ncbi:MAG: Eco57I restriction-modification methylase domain-containing protein, partial [Gammaproteobacteria bacterium]
KWALDERQLDDRHIVRRMILKKVIFGVDKNPMAVELAKVALWLHTFTVGAPLSFLDHHLKCGDSLHGETLETVRPGRSTLGTLFQAAELTRLEVAARSLEAVAELTDTSIAEAHESKRLADEAEAQVAPIHALLDFWRTLRWLVPGWPIQKKKKIGDKSPLSVAELAVAEIFSSRYNLSGIVIEGRIEGEGPDVRAANDLLARALALAKRERFFHWWTAFPTVWPAGGGGFDAVIGNPPWDRIKLQAVEWFAERELNIARQARAADRKRMVDDLRKKGAPLWHEYLEASERAESQARVLRDSDDYPLLGGGDVNLSCSSSAPPRSRSRKGSSVCSRPAASPPTRARRNSFAASPAPGGWRHCWISRTAITPAAAISPTWIRASSSAPWSSAARSGVSR